MRSCYVFLLLVGFIVAVQTQLTPPPECGALCLKNAIAASNCSSTDTLCICTDTQLTQTAELCVATTCTVRESLSTKNYSMATCGAPVRDETWSTLWLGIGFFILSLVTLLLRVLSRWVCDTPFYWDDYAMFGAIVSAAGFAGTSIALYVHGLGKDIWTVSFNDITYMLIAYYHGEWVYSIAVFFTMTSLLLFYLRIFPTRSVKIQVWIVMTVVILYTVLGALISINQCTPIRGAWEYWDGEEKFHCRNRNALGWASAIWKMVLDVAIILLPLRPLSQLALSKKKKAQVILMFAVGIFVTLVSMLRLRSLASFADSHNATWDYKEMGYWSQIEVHVGNVCACMPGIYSLLKKFWPKIIGTKQESSHMMDTIGSVKPKMKVQSRMRLTLGDEEDFVRLEDEDYVILNKGQPKAASIASKTSR
ncbi:uncharacterized protein CC84DRAFT_1229840 [Paraphaeosphaeria sporulosa]|uniref:CFEM domain-containing protein n=1 Tax=Paraphaeosphaeria sporulosa TaxID=1460663 RepID=A0A177C111_9PLEO|nr:uncharacterized protein CC84DRAFT_1229840 [Paraphaeosphaeria sporulosa]OAG01106.1 hypothetical protein CC84DRAFT_1229840 [Paraphaeosphaeria sporulosa]